ncbi:threonine/homoserine/homoserine lactone efflux protein [Flavobacterium arsenatis]|uniref:Threonine/homoserine/homoserine lactone efflux protein n=1 Tax=Flavobacterium arsenatis TaxID=1484332 RepID=A0ABU1TUB8_9FLAO|nr:LysE family transporter [Flavobacterium arsenatis]MDR6969474.1 threonine/homoserine/homoserine lactone efflux protein [Flavobacterium arsenatis]
MIQDILLAIPLGILLCFMIGPVFFVLLETAAVKGFRAAMVFDLGVVTADFVFIAIAYFSSYRLINNIKDEPALFIFGGLIMVTYGIISFVKLKRASKKIDESVEVELIKKNYGSLFVKGFLLNFINVGVLGFWLLIFITFGPQLELKTSRLMLFFTSVIATYLAVDIVKMLLAKKLKNKMTPTNILKIKKITSVILVIFGVTIMLQGWFPSDQKLVKKALEKIEPNHSK